MIPDLTSLVRVFLSLIYPLLTVFIYLALLVFFWGLVKFIFKAGDIKAHEDGKKLMVWGIIAIFVLSSFMGIIAFFSRDIGFGEVGFPFLPI